MSSRDNLLTNEKRQSTIQITSTILQTAKMGECVHEEAHRDTIPFFPTLFLLFHPCTWHRPPLIHSLGIHKRPLLTPTYALHFQYSHTNWYRLTHMHQPYGLIHSNILRENLSSIYFVYP